MEVILAGHNLDYEVIRELAATQPQRQDLTPETIAAAYARISRNPRPVNELRKAARGEVEKARASNRNIVFEMGHSSIAEHAVFNLDILRVSRLLVEEIEKFRLASYTEKSQRYVLLQEDYLCPAEVSEAGLEGSFRQVVQAQNAFYHQLYERLRPQVFAAHPGLAADPANRSLLEGWAKEDARYCLSLATETQLGMTANARNLELMIRRLAASPLAEAREYSQRLFDAVKAVAPSLVRYTEATAYDRDSGPALRERAGAAFARMDGVAGGESPVRLLFATPEADERIAAAILHTVSDQPFTRCLAAAGQMSGAEKESLFKEALAKMQAYDAAPRAFEQADLLYELIVSATCFAQLKRHRMASLTVQDYDPSLGVTVPQAIVTAGMEAPFRELCGRSEALWEEIRKVSPAAAAYILTNAHRRRVVMKVSSRELYHLARVRADRHAQWDIRTLACEMVERAREVMPLTLLLAAGKDGFPALYERIFADKV
ncbi:MAG: FAD-dependent thymidylate synthase [Syntrophaceae bacterium]|nr:FAD-dependent thymidylate synthase [Syntrophaceae bacterium]